MGWTAAAPPSYLLVVNGMKAYRLLVVIAGAISLFDLVGCAEKSGTGPSAKTNSARSSVTGENLQRTGQGTVSDALGARDVSRQQMDFRKMGN